MSDFFQFEADFVESLRCIPMQVRYKLDTCGVKLKLQHWHQFTQGERQSLVDLPCLMEAEVVSYREHLQRIVVEHTGHAASDLPIEACPAWMDETAIPVSVQEKATETGVGLTLEQWRSLLPLQRFVLLKLSRSGHENSNFLPAMQEFQLV
ncbi:nitrate reductase associated protein [Trichocoleus sp. FACHB-591]|uniref:nitrate reductase associated protein n=1 Tax=Trichocoleus sp. FACHB-591 TaxID=2692872 RepID=UPI001684F135|nr:nitrate reductase associated protein [Trichocoleus sp. FACHB-591]MBD2095501.1 nitrate reductase associated protein [Trichocoleus sp. FACHB-591]